MKLVLTLDYELYGNGGGNVIDHVVEPTNKFLEICHQHDIKATIFFEALEYLKMKETYASGVSMGYANNPAIQIENQMVSAHQQGHDIQLHIHPQWIGARYENKQWRLNEKMLKLPDVPMRQTRHCEIGLKDVLLLGKTSIEKIIHPIDPSYRCQFLRSGGMNITPSGNILAVMREIGLLGDSSVFAGGFAKTSYSDYDYRKVKNSSLPWYTTTHDILDMNATSGNQSRIYEFPVFALALSRIKKFTPNRCYKKLRNRSGIRTSFDYTAAKERKKFNHFFAYFVEKEPVIWDFCLLSNSQMRYFLAHAREVQSNRDHPFILIGHSKEFTGQRSLQKFIRHTKKHAQDVQFATIKEVFETLQRSASQQRNHS